MGGCMDRSGRFLVARVRLAPPAVGGRVRVRDRVRWVGDLGGAVCFWFMGWVSVEVLDDGEIWSTLDWSFMFRGCCFECI